MATTTLKTEATPPVSTTATLPTVDNQSVFLHTLPNELIVGGDQDGADVGIGTHCDIQTIGRLTRTCQLFRDLFKDSLLKARLLQHVAFGEQDQAEAMLNQLKKTNPGLLQKIMSEKGRVTDPGGRIFPSITAFQLAVWNMDVHMWEMLKKYQDDQESKAQFQELAAGITYTLNGKKTASNHYDFNDLLTPLNNYIKNYNKLASQQLAKYWCEEVGKAQKHTTAMVAQRYCNEVPFYPVPNFRKNQLFARCLILTDGSHWFDATAGLGVMFAIRKGRLPAQPVRLWKWWRNRFLSFFTSQQYSQISCIHEIWDWAALTALRQERMLDLEKLRAQFTPSLNI